MISARARFKVSGTALGPGPYRNAVASGRSQIPLTREKGEFALDTSGNMSKQSEDPSDIGQHFFYGVKRKKSYVKALPYLVQAATLNDTHCQNLVGYCYNLGLGTKKDLRQAIFWYQRAASNDDREALGNPAL